MTAKELLQTSATQLTVTARFRLPISEPEICDALTEIYKRIVESRNGIAVIDDHTTSHMQSVAKWLTSETAKPCLMLYGGVGNGKTTMLEAIKMLFSSIIELNKQQKKDYWKAEPKEKQFMNWIERYILPCDLRNAVSVNKAPTVEYDGLCKSRFLLIDDMGTEPTTIKDYGTERTPLIDLIHLRYEKRMFLVVSSNLDDNSITSRYGERTADRFAEAFDKINYSNKSYRL